MLKLGLSRLFKGLWTFSMV